MTAKTDPMEKIRQHRDRIAELRRRRDGIQGELAEARRQLAEATEALKENHGVETVEEARELVTELERKIKEDEEKVEKVLAQAEAALEA